MTAFRRVPEADYRRYDEILRYAFAPERGPLRDDTDDPPDVVDRYGLYDDGLRSTCKLYDLQGWLRTGYEDIGGLGAVATPPEDRREGYVRELLRGALAEFADRSASLVTLWPFETDFYAQFGWTVADYRVRYECSPKHLPTTETRGQMRPRDAEECEAFRPAERAHSEGLALSLRRSPEWWRERTLTNWDGGPEPYSYGYDRDGESAATVVYTIDDTQTLSVKTLLTADDEAYVAVLDFLASHDSQVDTLGFSRPEEDLLGRLDAPEAVECTVEPGAMVRASSISALDGLGWHDADLDCTVSVSDPLAGDQTVHLAVSDGSLSVEQSDREPNAETDIGTLSALVVGAQSVDRARELDSLAVTDDAVLDGLRDAFGPQQVSHGEFY